MRITLTPSYSGTIVKLKVHLMSGAIWTLDTVEYDMDHDHILRAFRTLESW